MNCKIRSKMVAILGLSFLFINNLNAQNEGNSELKQTAWTLQACLDYAREHNIQLKQLNLQTKTAAVNLKQSKDNQLPNANANFSHGVNLGKNINPATNTFDTQASQFSQLSVGSGITLYNGKKLKHTIAQRELQYELTKLEVEEAATNIDLSLLSAYLQILLAEEQLKVLKDQAKTTELQLEKAEKMVKAGVIPAGDLLDIKAQIANDGLNQLNAENGIDLAYLALAQTLDYYDAITIVTPNIVLPSINDIESMGVQAMYEKALEEQPQLKTAQLRSEIANYNVTIAETNKYPVVSLNASVNSVYSSLRKDFSVTGADTTWSLIETPYLYPTGDPIEFPIFGIEPMYQEKNIPYYTQMWDNLGGGINLNVAIPIFNRYQVHNGVELAKIGVENSLLAQEIAKNSLRRSIEQAYLDAKLAARRYEVTQSNIEALQKALNHTEKKFKLGMATTFDYLIAKNNLAIAELNVASAKYEYYFRLKILDYYQGKPLNTP